MNNKLAENLKIVRKEHNMSQEQLALELGVSRQAISKWESAVAYPEMDKIIALCDKFNLNIDDLLHKNIKEVDENKNNQNKVNKVISNFLKFITDTINLFCSMNFKSKIKCLFEQSIIIIILFIICLIIYFILETFFINILEMLPDNIEMFIKNVLDFIVIIFLITSSIIILIHIFKTRYLDYYETCQKIENENNNTEEETNNKKENKIVIRDPIHSEYHFINALFKIIIGIIKFFAFCLAIIICFILLFIASMFIISFLIYQTGYFFIGILIVLLSSALITTLALVIDFNFIFNRNSNKKVMIRLFIASIILVGLGIGLIFIGSLDFEILNNNENVLKTEYKEIEMQDNLFINSSNIKYIEKDIDNVRIEYQVNKYYEVSLENTNYDGVFLYVDCIDEIKLVKDYINNINHKKIIPMDIEPTNIVIYASKNNIDKLETNEEKYKNNI